MHVLLDHINTYLHKSMIRHLHSNRFEIISDLKLLLALACFWALPPLEFTQVLFKVVCISQTLPFNFSQHFLACYPWSSSTPPSLGRGRVAPPSPPAWSMEINVRKNLWTLICFKSCFCDHLYLIWLNRCFSPTTLSLDFVFVLFIRHQFDCNRCSSANSIPPSCGPCLFHSALSFLTKFQSANSTLNRSYRPSFLSNQEPLWLASLIT